MTPREPPSPEEVYLQEHITAQIGQLRRLIKSTAAKADMGEDMRFIIYLLELVWLETSNTSRKKAL